MSFLCYCRIPCAVATKDGVVSYSCNAMQLKCKFRHRGNNTPTFQPQPHQGPVVKVDASDTLLQKHLVERGQYACSCCNQINTLPSGLKKCNNSTNHHCACNRVCIVCANTARCIKRHAGRIPCTIEHPSPRAHEYSCFVTKHPTRSRSPVPDDDDDFK